MFNEKLQRRDQLSQPGKIPQLLHADYRKLGIGIFSEFLEYWIFSNIGIFGLFLEIKKHI